MGIHQFEVWEVLVSNPTALRGIRYSLQNRKRGHPTGIPFPFESSFICNRSELLFYSSFNFNLLATNLNSNGFLLSLLCTLQSKSCFTLSILNVCQLKNFALNGDCINESFLLILNLRCLDN